jgi:hypothetical protein
MGFLPQISHTFAIGELLGNRFSPLSDRISLSARRHLKPARGLEQKYNL